MTAKLGLGLPEASSPRNGFGARMPRHTCFYSTRMRESLDWTGHGWSTMTK